MLLAIDIGNTNISFGIFRINKLIRRFDMPTRNYSQKELRKKLGQLELDDAVISSVVPGSANILAQELKKIAGRTPYIIGKDIKAPIKNLYRKPKQVGQDRLVNAYAGVMLYGAPLIIVDFGTAITFDVVSKNKAYLGGMILPGLQLSLDALSQNTALLPVLRLKAPKEFIGRDTKSSMLSGIVYGFASLTDSLLKRIRGKIAKHAKVVGTGGNINLIGKYCRQLDKKDRDLTLKGLNLIYKNL